MPNPIFDKWTGARKAWVNPRVAAGGPVPSAVGNAGTLPGFTQGGMGPFGAVPQVPDPGASAAGAIAANLANLPAIHNILNDIDPTVGTRRGIIGEKLAGMVPEDVEYQLAQRAAERGIGGGSVNADYLKALGLTSLGIQNEGFGQAGALAGQVFGIESPNFVTPAQEQEAQYWANLMAAAPDPAAAAAYALALQRMGMRAGGAGGGGDVGEPDWMSDAYGSAGGKGAAPNVPRGIQPPSTSGTVPKPTTGWGYTPGPGYGGEEFDVPFDGGAGGGGGGGGAYPWLNQAPMALTPSTDWMDTGLFGTGIGLSGAYGTGDDYGTGWSNFPGFENLAPTTPVNSGPFGGEEFEWEF